MNGNAVACDPRHQYDARDVLDVARVVLIVALHQAGTGLLSSAYRSVVSGPTSFLVSFVLAVVLYVVVLRRPGFAASAKWAVLSVVANVLGVMAVWLGLAQGTVLVGDCLRAIGGVWVMYCVSMALVDVCARRGFSGMLAILAAGWVLALPVSAATSSLPLGGQFAVLALCPAVVAAFAFPSVVRSARACALADPGVRITEPRSFLSVGSAVFVMFTLLKVSYCFASRFVNSDSVASVPMLWAVVVSAALLAALTALMSRLGRPVLGMLYRVTLACVIIGFMLYVPRVFGQAWTSVAAGVVLGVGGDLSRILAQALLAQLALRNPASAPGVALVVAAINTAGSLIGSTLADYALGLDASPLTYQLLLIGFAALLVVINLAVPKALAFDEAVQEVSPLVVPVASAPVDLIEPAVTTVAEESRLTPRETETLGLLARGHSAQAIQERLGISRNTVKMHVRNVYAKLGVHSQQELIDLVESRCRL